MKKSIFITLSDGVSNRFDPIGARYIIKVIEENNHKVSFYQDRIIKRENILNKISTEKPDLIWISIQPDTENLFNFLTDISKIYRNTIILGNIGSRWITSKNLRTLNKNIIIVIGNGEVVTEKLLRATYSTKFSYKNIQNISNIRGFIEGKYFTTDINTSVQKKDIVPSTNELKSAVERGDIITIRTSSGCNSSCTFCSVRNLNDGMKWKAYDEKTIYATLKNIINAGLVNGIIRFIDDDTAVSLPYLLNISRIFKKLNQTHGTCLKFGFATNAMHLYNQKDTSIQKNYREEVWKEIVINGLSDLFLGLESGSNSQLKRFGKKNTSIINYKAYDFAKKIGVNLEIGFIPIDPFMQDEYWKSEFIENIKLAKYTDSYLSSPTWLSSIRVYENSPLKLWLHKHKLLGKKIPYSNEYRFSYLSKEVELFIKTLNICLCDDAINNKLYRLKREVKNIIRYETQHSKNFIEKIKLFSYNYSYYEFEFIESIIKNNNIKLQKSNFIRNILILTNSLSKELESSSNEPYIKNIRASLLGAVEDIKNWQKAKVVSK